MCKTSCPKYTGTYALNPGLNPVPIDILKPFMLPHIFVDFTSISPHGNDPGTEATRQFGRKHSIYEVLGLFVEWIRPSDVVLQLCLEHRRTVIALFGVEWL